MVGVLLVAIPHGLPSFVGIAVCAVGAIWLSRETFVAARELRRGPPPDWVLRVQDLLEDEARAITTLYREQRRTRAVVEAGYFALDVPASDGAFRERLRATLEQLDDRHAERAARRTRLAATLALRREVLAPPLGSDEHRLCAAALWRGLEAMEDQVDARRAQILEATAAAIRRIDGEAPADAALTAAIADALLDWSAAEHRATAAARGTDADAYIEAVDAVPALFAAVRALVARLGRPAAREPRPSRGLR